MCSLFNKDARLANSLLRKPMLMLLTVFTSEQVYSCQAFDWQPSGHFGITWYNTLDTLQRQYFSE